VTVNAWPMYRAMVGVGFVSGVLIVTAFLATGPVIERKRAEALHEAILDVLPGSRSSVTFRLTADDRFAVVDGTEDGGAVVYAGYNESGGLVGVALEARGAGYQDVIRVLYGYSFTEEAVVGFRVLESRETPGLGALAASDPGFLGNFDRLDASLAADGTALAHSIRAVRRGEKRYGWEIDGITGATVTSQAIASMLDRSVAYWIPKLRRRSSDFGDQGRSNADESPSR
jgi:electron transport complex protein RnfG